jgi:FHA domain-containing protein
MTTKCVDGGELFDDDRQMCMDHICEAAPVAATGAPVEPDSFDGQERRGGPPERKPWSTEICWRCGTRSPNLANTDCLNQSCRRSLMPPVLHIGFRDGEVELRAGQRAELGRNGSHGRLFRSFPNVSRRHAVVGVDTDGFAWIEPFPTPNGTFVNGGEIYESVSRALASGDSVRFALHAEGTVTLYSQ